MNSSWEILEIGEITNNLDNRRIPLNGIERTLRQVEGKYPYFGANGEVDRIDDYIFDEKFLCVAEDGGSWGQNQKCAYIVDEKCWVNNHAHVLTAKSNTHLEYLRYFFNLTDLNSYITGTTRGKLTRGALDRIKIPLPPLAEQKRIAAVLDKADAVREKRRRSIKKLDSLLQSVFLDMFGDPVSNPKGFERKEIGELIKVKSGNFLPEKSFGIEGKVPVYGGNGISGFHDEYMFDNPKIVIGRVGVYCGAVHVTQKYSWVTDNALFVAEQSEKLQDAYLAAALKQANLNQYAGRFAQPLISASRIYPIKMIVPPLELQDKYAASITQLETVRTRLKKAGNETEILFQSLQQRAFAGELFGAANGEIDSLKIAAAD